MLYNILLILLIIDSLVLIVAVLMQAGQGGGMAASFGGVSSSASSFMGARQAGNLLTKASWWCGGLFLGLSFLLALASIWANKLRSLLTLLGNIVAVSSIITVVAPRIFFALSLDSSMPRMFWCQK